MSRFDTNPFGENSAPVGTSESAPSAVNSFFERAAAAFSASPVQAKTIDSSAITTQDIRSKEAALKAKEEELRRKEEELEGREAALGILKKNFPPFFPLIHHDIDADIPQHMHYIAKPAFICWLGVMLCLVFNLIAVMFSWIGGAVSVTSAVGNFLLAVIFVLSGVPLSYIFWYLRLYNALKRDSAIGFGVFFIGFGIHTGFCIYAAIAPPIFFNGMAVTGILSMLYCFATGYIFVAVFYTIGTVLFLLESLLSLYVLGRVYAYFRGNGSIDKMRQEAALSAITGGTPQV